MPRAARVTKDKLTLKEEAFCCEYFSNGGNGEEAYRKSYKANAKRNEDWVRAEAYRLLKKPHILSRIIVLQAELRKNAQYDANVAMTEMKAVYDGAMKKEQYGPAIASARARAEVAGVIVRKSDVTTHTLGQMSSSEIEEAMQRAAKEAGYVIQKMKQP
jgi:hypothetical protein